MRLSAGSVRMQLMQVYSQKSTSTTLLLSSFLSDRGRLLSQARPPVKSGAGVPGVNSARAPGEDAAMKAAARIAGRMRSFGTMPPKMGAMGPGNGRVLYSGGGTA